MKKKRKNAVEGSICLECGKEFFRYQGPKKYCSRECFSRGRKKLPELHICEECGGEFKKKSSIRFCSWDCSLVFSKTGKIVKCDNCGKGVYRRLSALLKQFNTCSVACQREYLKKINKGPKKKYKLNPKLRWEVLERDRFACVYCGFTREDGIKLHIDHIIPRSKGGKDNIENLVTACDECNLGKSDKIVPKLTVVKTKKVDPYFKPYSKSKQVGKN